MFNDYWISIYKRTPYKIDRHGNIEEPNYQELEPVKTIMVDVQPISNARVTNVYGNYTNYSYEVFMDCIIKDLNTDEYVVLYDGEYYDILSFSVWLGLPGNRTQMLIGKDK